MIPEVMVAVTTRKFRFQNAILRDYARFTVKGESYPGIVKITEAVTEGIIYFDVDEVSLERLDDFEGDLYQRTPVRVATEGQEMFNAETYVIKPKFKGYLSSEKWSPKEFVRKDLKAFLKTYSGFHKSS